MTYQRAAWVIGGLLVLAGLAAIVLSLVRGFRNQAPNDKTAYRRGQNRRTASGAPAMFGEGVAAMAVGFGIIFLFGS